MPKRPVRDILNSGSPKPENTNPIHNAPSHAHPSATNKQEHVSNISADTPRKRATSRGRINEPFVFVLIQNNTIDAALPLTDTAPSTLANLAVLACHASFNDNVLMIANRRGSKRMERRDIKKRLRLPPRSFERFWAAVHPTNVKTVSVNGADGYTLTGLFHNGELPTDRFIHVQKLYIDSLQSLYDNGRVRESNGTFRAVSPADHRSIGRILLLLPYLHTETNILCWNPNEKNPDRICPLSNNDIAQILSLDIAHITREIKKLLTLTFPVKCNTGKEMMLRAFARYQTENQTAYYINPALAFMGSDNNGYDNLIQQKCFCIDEENP